MEKVNIAEKLRVFDKYWQSKMVGEFNDQQVKLTKMKGDFDWHYHNSEDEFYLMLKGTMVIKFRDVEISLKEGEFFIIPKGTEHKMFSEDEVHVLTIEPASTLNKMGTAKKAVAEDSSAGH